MGLSALIVAAGWAAGIGLGWRAFGWLEQSNPRAARVVKWILLAMIGAYIAVFACALLIALVRAGSG